MSGTSTDEPAITRRRTLSRTVGRYKVGIVAATLAAVVAGYVVSTLIPPTYTATTTIVLAAPQANGDPSAELERRVRLESSRLMSRAVLAPVAEQLGSDITVGGLRDRVSVTTDPAIGVLEVSVSADDPDTAADIANLVAVSYEQASGEANAARVQAAQEALQGRTTELRREIAELEATTSAAERDPASRQRLETLRTQLGALQTTSGELAADAAVFGSGIAQIDEATPPRAPSSPRPLRNALIAGAIALVIELIVALWHAGAVQRRPDPAVLLGAPMLAEIPDFGRSATGDGTNPLLDIEAAEAFQFLLSAFGNATARAHARSILVTSALPGEGKSLTAVHLARALAVQGRDVMLVDADIRARGLTRMLNAEDQPGLVALAEGEDLESVVRRFRISDVAQLPVIPAGRPPHQPTGLLGTARYREAIATITATSELTIVDGGPLLTVADPAVLAMQLSAILLVIDADTSEDDLVQIRQRLALAGTPVLGYVVNRVRRVRSRAYTYPYPDGEPPTETDRRRRGRPSRDAEGRDDDGASTVDEDESPAEATDPSSEVGSDGSSPAAADAPSSEIPADGSSKVAATDASQAASKD